MLTAETNDTWLCREATYRFFLIGKLQKQKTAINRARFLSRHSLSSFFAEQRSGKSSTKTSHA